MRKTQRELELDALGRASVRYHAEQVSADKLFAFLDRIALHASAQPTLEGRMDAYQRGAEAFLTEMR